MATLHPGQYFKDMTASQTSPRRLAMMIGMSEFDLVKFMSGAMDVDNDLAEVLAKATSTTPDYWLEMQLAYDIAACGKPLITVREADRQDV